MKCIKCKFKDENTGACTYPFEVVTVGDNELDTKGNIIGCAHMEERNNKTLMVVRDAFSLFFGIKINHIYF